LLNIGMLAARWELSRTDAGLTQELSELVSDETAIAISAAVRAACRVGGGKN